MVLFRLLRNIDPMDYCLISRNDYVATKSINNSGSLLRGRYYRLVDTVKITNINMPLIRPCVRVIRHLLNFYWKYQQLKRIIRNEKCGALLACSGDLWDIPLGYLVSLSTNVNYYVYLFDHYSEQWVTKRVRYFARVIEPIILRHTTVVVVPNEFLADEINRRYKVKTVVIHNPIDNSNVASNGHPWPLKIGEINIVYTGAIYHVNINAFRNLIVAMNEIEYAKIYLHIYTSQSFSELKQEGIDGTRVVFHDHLAPDQISKIQQQADILFLPLVFRSSILSVIKTSAPGKMGEYLASGRPILANTPYDSFVSWYFREYRCGCLVHEEDPEEIAKGIKLIIDSPQLRNHMVQNALKRAVMDFNPSVAQEKFVELFSKEQASVTP
jgi:glycosyltransferase involved in cell wall biosynthesis